MRQEACKASFHDGFEAKVEPHANGKDILVHPLSLEDVIEEMDRLTVAAWQTRDERPELRDECTRRSLIFGSALFHLKKFTELLDVVRDVACALSPAGTEQ